MSWVRSRSRRRLVGSLALVLSVGLAGLLAPVAGARADQHRDTGLLPPVSTATDTTATSTAAAPEALTVDVGQSPTSEPLPVGFLGFSTEFSALHAYLGSDPRSLNPLFVQLLEGIDQGHPPVLRVGGNSTDNSWVPEPGVIPPPGVTYAITSDWLQTVHALARETGAHLILGVNLAADDAQMASVEARALVDGIGRQHVEALEIGNEPDLYPYTTWYEQPGGEPVTRRGPMYGVGEYLANFNRWRAILPAGIHVAFGALAELNWLGAVDPQAAADPDVSMVTVHRYPLVNCESNPNAPDYPTLANLLSANATEGLAAPLAPYAAQLHASGRQLRIDEFNTVACEGRAGLSNTFAASLWALNALFDMAAANVDGINLHTLPGSQYAPFTFTDTNGQWTATVAPVYYGMLMFASAFPTGSQLVSDTITNSSSADDVKVYSTQSPDGTLRTTIINEDATSPADVSLTLPPGTSTLEQETLTAPAISSTSGVSLGGQSFAEPTSTGQLAPAQQTPVSGQNGQFSVNVAPYSAVTLTASS